MGSRIVYVIRTQGGGMLWNKVYASPPSRDDIQSALADELERHGIDKDDKPKKRWARVVEVDLVDGAGKDGVTTETFAEFDSSSLTELLKKRAEATAAVGIGASGSSQSSPIVFEGQGHVRNPDGSE